MTHQSSPSLVSGRSDAGSQVAQLRHVLELVEEIAGGGSRTAQDVTADDNMRINSAYESICPVARRRFDALAEEVTSWAAAGVQALLAGQGRAEGGQAEPPRAAAAGLARELGAALPRLTRIIGA